MRRVVLLGIDSISWNLIDPFIEKGILPKLKKLKEKGIATTLLSTYPPISPTGWASLFTGFEPVRHRIFDFIKRRKDSYFIEPIESHDRKKPFIWEYLSQNNKRTVAIGIPFTYPPQPLNGILVSGLGTPSKDSDFTYPLSFKEKILQNYPDFDVDFEENNLGDITIDRDYILHKVKQVTESQFLLSKDLFIKEKWDFFCAVFRSTDVIQHYFIDKKSVLEEYYKQVDSYIGWFMTHMGKEDVLLVCSDHGGAPVHTRFNINTWLFKNGYLSIKKSKINLAVLNLDALETRLLKSPLKKIVWKIKRTRLIEYLLALVQPFSRSKLLGDYNNVVWEKTKLYSLPTSTGLIFINQAEREPDGIVSYIERSSLLKEFKEKIEKLTYKGKKVVKEVVVIDNLYPNRKNTDVEVPDCVVILAEGFTIHPTFSTEKDVFVPEKVRIGDHTSEGICIVYSQKELLTPKTKMFRIYDIVPTVLSLLGVKTDITFDGIQRF